MKERLNSISDRPVTKEINAGERQSQVAIVLDQINLVLEEQNKFICTLENRLVNVCHQAVKEATDSAAKIATDDMVPLAQALTVVLHKLAAHNEWIKGITARIEV